MCGIVGVISRSPVNQLIYDALLLLHHERHGDAFRRTDETRLGGWAIAGLTVLGLGLGNASNSNLGRGFTGEFALQYVPVRQTSVILFLLEIGVAGLLLSWLVLGTGSDTSRSTASSASRVSAGCAKKPKRPTR